MLRNPPSVYKQLILPPKGLECLPMNPVEVAEEPPETVQKQQMLPGRHTPHFLILASIFMAVAAQTFLVEGALSEAIGDPNVHTESATFPCTGERECATPSSLTEVRKATNVPRLGAFALPLDRFLLALPLLTPTPTELPEYVAKNKAAYASTAYVVVPIKQTPTTKRPRTNDPFTHIQKETPPRIGGKRAVTKTRVQKKVTHFR